MVDGGDSSQFIMGCNQATFHLDDLINKDNTHKITIEYDKQSCLPIMHTYTTVLELANALALTAFLMGEQNQYNLLLIVLSLSLTNLNTV